MRTLIALFLFLLACSSASIGEGQIPGISKIPGISETKQESPKYEPTDHYAVRKIDGWKVLVNKTLISDHPELCERTLSLLEHQLFKVTRRVPAAAVGKLKKIPIWVEVNEPHHKCMAYHPDAGWLRSHDMNPDKAGCVEIANARNFLVWTIEQPYMVLHELAHGYHHRFLGGFDNAEILAAYRAAKQNKRYDSVLRYNGKQVRAYAATNQMEYFAELSEAYFGTNDFYPFVRSELRKHDPEMYELLGNLWGDRPSSVRQEKKAGEQKRGSPP